MVLRPEICSSPLGQTRPTTLYTFKLPVDLSRYFVLFLTPGWSSQPSWLTIKGGVTVLGNSQNLMAKIQLATKVVKRARQISHKKGCGRCSTDLDQLCPIAMESEKKFSSRMIKIFLWMWQSFIKDQHKGWWKGLKSTFRARSTYNIRYFGKGDPDVW